MQKHMPNLGRQAYSFDLKYIAFQHYCSLSCRFFYVLFYEPSSKSYKVNGYIPPLCKKKHAYIAKCWSELAINKNNLKDDRSTARNQR